MKKRRPKPTMTPALALAAMRAQAVNKEALRRGDSKQWASGVRVGDLVTVDPVWNQTERWANQIPTPAVVVDILKARSQTGILYAVQTNDGQVRQLDAGWFIAQTMEQDKCEKSSKH